MKQTILPSQSKRYWETKSRLVNDDSVIVDSLTKEELKEELLTIQLEIADINQQLREYKINSNIYKSKDYPEWYRKAEAAKTIRGRIQQKLQARLGLIKDTERREINKANGITEEEWSTFYKVLSWVRTNTMRKKNG